MGELCDRCEDGYYGYPNCRGVSSLVMYQITQNLNFARPHI